MSNHISLANILSTDDTHFEAQYSLNPSELGLMQLTQLSILDVVGTDAIDFLQNMLSNDVQHLPAESVRCACLCSPKGRVIATFDYWLQPIILDDSKQILPRVRLLLAADIKDTVYATLKRFILRKKVQLILPAEQLIIGLIGTPEQLFPQAKQLVTTIPDEQKTGLVDINLAAIKNLVVAGNGQNQQITEKPKLASYQIVRFNNVIIDNVCMARIITFIEPTINSLSSHQQQINSLNLLSKKILLSLNLKVVHEKYWDRLAIYSGQVRISAATSDRFIPQMINFELIDGVDFKKGCYPGQEVIARSQYRGAVKRRMQRGHAVHAEIGQDIFAFNTNKEQAEICGQVLMAAPAVEGGVDCLIEINKSYISAEYQFYVHEPKLRLNLKNLPYSII